MTLERGEILGWLRETRSERLDMLWACADDVRKSHVGDAVHLRGLVRSQPLRAELWLLRISLHNPEVQHYRMTAEEILECARQAVGLGFGTIVLQSGEDYGLTRDFVTGLVRRIKDETPLAVTLSLGERPEEDLTIWRKAGADRYLLRFETSDAALYERIHPSLPGRPSDRFTLLAGLRELGYEIGSGVMIGIPGQSYDSLAQDILRFAELDLDMIGCGPFIPHLATPLGNPRLAEPDQEQVPATETMTYKVLSAGATGLPRGQYSVHHRLGDPQPGDGAGAGAGEGRQRGHAQPDARQYRALYEIYPDKACIHESGGGVRRRTAASNQVHGADLGRRTWQSARLPRSAGRSVNFVTIAT